MENSGRVNPALVHLNVLCIKPLPNKVHFQWRHGVLISFDLEWECFLFCATVLWLMLWFLPDFVTHSLYFLVVMVKWDKIPWKGEYTCCKRVPPPPSGQIKEVGKALTESRIKRIKVVMEMKVGLHSFINRICNTEHFQSCT